MRRNAPSVPPPLIDLTVVDEEEELNKAKPVSVLAQVLCMQ